jgi:periplasmic glucans biosynthesis protein
VKNFADKRKSLPMPKAVTHDFTCAPFKPGSLRAAVWALVACALIAAATSARAAAFGFEDVALQAQALAQSPYRKPPVADAQRAALDYDAVRRIQFRQPQALWRGSGSPFEMQFFPVAGEYVVRALQLHEITDGKVRALTLPSTIFNNDGVLPPDPPGSSALIAGWKVTYPLNEAGKRDEVAAFLGSNYFRALGQGQRYGLSARGVAIDTVGGANGEEFPDFTSYWFETPKPGAAGSAEFVFYAMLDGPRVTGAYRFALKPGADTTVDVRARLYFRAGSSAVATVGFAPLTSMYLHGENQPAATVDFRPEVHDSDGLQIESAEGEWLWRPLTNPRSPFVTSFALRSPRGFGLMQRDRAFASYEDVEARYELRPSAWVEPIGDWGAGRVELLQFRTPDETHDNIAAYWVPASAPQAGTPLELSWRVHWQGQAQRLPPAAHVTQTRTGYGYTKSPQPKQRHKMLIDFAGPTLAAAEQAQNVQAPIEAVASASPNGRIVRVNAYPNPARNGWRATLEFDRVDAKQAVELRVFLRQGANTLSETWSYALAPE